ncbi:NADH-ubiquinone oxidoreductase 14.8 kDa subunit [Ascobolus immersus RN42]|uniref:NADH-ubiquinone oxidoreductase 14.8 kDa subunit n=1 Tax=Ascobolus immersus RN42 TaxID=1160509 RepID=A0A3N4ISI1_ASCIM|nr:NADH-ubiquinone oxidoreductase 14.8 kDa subunit [Ascobolus immersus RN42]
MVIQATALAKTTRSSLNWADARRRVISHYREWQKAVPEIQKIYTLDIPVPTIRAKIRQEFERQRHVQQLPVVDVLLQKGHAEYQETVNYWKQLPHVMKFFRAEEDPRARVSGAFMENFLQGRN